MRAPRDQHFLIDRQAIETIADSIPISGRRVLEIGPGEGALTQALLCRSAKVIAIELDHHLCEYLAMQFASEIATGQLTLIRGNALKCDIPPFDCVIANLPYSASSKLMFRLLDMGFNVAVLMFQKEFAQRMIARPKTSAFGRLSVMVQTFAEARVILELSPKAFSPRPQVWSWVMKIIPRPPPFEIYDRAFHAQIVRALFSHRRKTVRKALKIEAPLLDGDRVEAILASVNDEILQARPERLELEQFAEIANSGSFQ